MIIVSIGLLMLMIGYLKRLQPAVSEYLLQPEESHLRQRMRSLEKLLLPY